MKHTRMGIKVLGMLVVAFLSFLIFSNNTVNATETNDLQSIADMLSKETIKVNASSEKFYEATNIQEQLNDLVYKKGLSNIKVSEVMGFAKDTLWYGADGELVDDFKFNGDRIYYPKFTVSNGSDIVETRIHIEYTDSNKYDSKVAENIKKVIDNDNTPELFMVNIEEMSNKIKEFKNSSNETWESDMWNNIISEYYKKLFNDNSIEASLISTQGGISELYFSKTKPALSIFKNGTYYGTRTYNDGYGLVKITVPYETADTNDAFINSALPKLKEYLGSESVTMKYLKTESNHKIYNVEVGKEYKGQVIIERASKPETPQEETKPETPKEETKSVTNTDKSTNIKFDTTTAVVPAGTTLVAEKVTKGDNYNTVVKAVEKDVSKFVLYDISLINNNAKVQPNGKVKVSIPVPNGYDISKIVVYRIAEDGTKTKLNSSVKDGYVVFETDHFSNYIVGEEKVEETTTTPTSTPATTTTNSTEKKLDSTPKTGEESNVVTIISSILSIISILGLAVVKKF